MPMLNAGGSWYDWNNGGHLMVIKNAAGRLSPHLLVDTHQGAQARCERNPGARTSEGLLQASELYEPRQAWQRMGEPTVAINANFFDVRPQKGGSWRTTGCSSPLGAFWTTPTVRVAPTRRSRHGRLPRQAGPVGRRRELVDADDDDPSIGRCALRGVAQSKTDYDSATPVVEDLLNKNEKFVAVSGIGLLSPGHTEQLHDPGGSAARTALAYAKQKDEMYIFQGGDYTPDNIQDLFRDWVAIPRSCSTAVGRRPLCCVVTPGACGPAPGRPRDPATPGRCCATLMNADYPAGSRSISR